MNKLDVKKLVLLNLPYVFAFYFADKIAAVFRLAPGTEFIDKLTNGFAVFGTAFANPLPSFHPVDLLVGLVAGALLKLAVYVKGKNRKKLRQGEEYGSARWGKPEDIKPYMDPEFSNNVILTQTEFLTMNSRPKQPKYARNKNILVIGGSGSGKTRFFVKPNLMQMHSSYVVTDPKGTVLVECGKMLEKGGYVIKSLNTINSGNPCTTTHSRISTATWVFVLAGDRIAFKLLRSPRLFSARNTPYSVQMSVPLTSAFLPNIASIAISR